MARVSRERNDSMGESSEEQAKRKREVLGNAVDEAEIFKRSRKVRRSPIGKGRNEELKEELKEGLKEVKQEIREVADGQKETMRIEIEKIKEDLKMREERWNKEREELKERIERMKQGLEGLKIGRKEEGGGNKRKGKKGRCRKKDGGEEEWRERVRKLERRYEQKERGERKRTILLKGLKKGEGGLKENVEEVMKRIGVEVKVEEIRKIEAGKRERGNMVMVKVGSEDEKRRIMQSKWKLKGKDIWVEKNLTWGGEED